MGQEHYIIRGGLEGRERLRVIARILKPSTGALFERVGIGPGLRVLDAGCGGGDVTLDLARRVGPHGAAIGFDTDETKLALAREDAARQQLTNVLFQRSDITALAEERAYDVIYSRFLLSHLPDPAGAVTKLFSALRPAGLLIVEDVDHSGCFCEPDLPAYRSYVSLYRQAAARRGVDPDIGPRLPRLLIGAGFTSVELSIVQPAALEGETKLGVPLTLENIAPAILADGLATRQELDTIIRELYAAARDVTTLMSFPRIVQAWGRRPR
jgi:SAM-dependent methyltransferase